VRRSVRRPAEQPLGESTPTGNNARSPRRVIQRTTAAVRRLIESRLAGGTS
jgi:hypothetical protein